VYSFPSPNTYKPPLSSAVTMATVIAKTVMAINIKRSMIICSGDGGGVVVVV